MRRFLKSERFRSHSHSTGEDINRRRRGLEWGWNCLTFPAVLVLLTLSIAPVIAKSPAPKRDAVTEGKKVYDTFCLGCHGVDADAGINGPSLQYVFKKGESFVRTIIVKGDPPNMPPSRFTKTELSDLVAYLKKHQKKS